MNDTRSRQTLTPEQEAFFDAMIAAALRSENDSTDDRGGDPLEDNYGPEDIDEATYARLQREAVRFVERHAALIEERDYEAAGHDFWLTRRGHGAGFWDGDWPLNGDALTAASKAFGEVDLYIGDDGRIYGYFHKEETC